VALCFGLASGGWLVNGQARKDMVAKEMDGMPMMKMHGMAVFFQFFLQRQ